MNNHSDAVCSEAVMPVPCVCHDGTGCHKQSRVGMSLDSLRSQRRDSSRARSKGTIDLVLRSKKDKDEYRDDKVSLSAPKLICVYCLRLVFVRDT